MIFSIVYGLDRLSDVGDDGGGKKEKAGGNLAQSHSSSRSCCRNKIGYLIPGERRRLFDSPSGGVFSLQWCSSMSGLFECDRTSRMNESFQYVCHTFITVTHLTILNFLV